MRRVASAMLLGLTAALAAGAPAALAEPLTAGGGVLVDRLPLAKPGPVPESGSPVTPLAPAPDRAPLHDGMALAPGTVLKPGFFGPSSKDAWLDGPAGGLQPRGLGDTLLDAGPGLLLQKQF